MTPTESKPTYVPPSLSGQGVAAFMPSNTNPAPGVYVPAPPSHVPAWTMAPNPPNPGQKRFTYTPNSNQQQNPAQQWQNAHASQPNAPYQQQQTPQQQQQQQQQQYQSSPPIPAAYGSASQPTQPQNWSSQSQQGAYQQYPSGPGTTSQQPPVTQPPGPYTYPTQTAQAPPASTQAPQQSPSFTTYQVSPYASPNTTPAPQSSNHRDSITFSPSPVAAPPALPRRTSSTVSIGRKPVSGSQSSAGTPASSKPSASALGSGGPSDWEHYGAAFELPSNPSPPPSEPSVQTPVNQSSLVVSPPIEEVDERSITPAPLNIKRTSPSPSPSNRSGRAGDTHGDVHAEVHGDVPASAWELGVQSDPVSRRPSPLSQDGLKEDTKDVSKMDEYKPGNSPVELSVDTDRRSESDGNALGSPYELPHQPMDAVEVDPSSSIAHLDSETVSTKSLTGLKLSDVVPDLDYWYLSSLERYLEMLRLEAHSKSSSDRKTIFNDFIVAEARMRGLDITLKDRDQNDVSKDNSTTPVPGPATLSRASTLSQVPSVQTFNLSHDHIEEEEYSPGGRPILRAATGLQRPVEVSPERETEKFPAAPQEMPPRNNSLDKAPRSYSVGPETIIKPYRHSVAAMDVGKVPIRPMSTANIDTRSVSPSSRVLNSRPSYQAFAPGRKESTSSVPSTQDVNSRRATMSNAGRPEHDEMFIGSNQLEDSRKSSLASPRSDSISIVAAYPPPSSSPQQQSPLIELSSILPIIIKDPNDRAVPLHAALQPIDSAFRGYNTAPKTIITNLHQSWQRRATQPNISEPDALRNDYMSFEGTVFTPSYNGIQAEIAGLMDLMMQLEKFISTATVGLSGLSSLSAAMISNTSPTSPTPAGSDSSISPPLTQVLVLYTHLASAISTRHSLITNLVNARDRLFARSELVNAILALPPGSSTPTLQSIAPSPILSNTPESAFVVHDLQPPHPTDPSVSDNLRNLLAHFLAAAANANLATATDATNRTKRNRDVVDESVARGVRADEADLARIATLFASLDVGTSSAEEAETLLTLADRSEQACQALQSQSLRLLSQSLTEELALNDADAANSRAGAVQQGAPREVFVRLESERRAEIDRIEKEAKARENGVRERVEKAVCDVTKIKDLLEEKAKKGRLEKALMAAKKRNGEA
jgi:hypothetical protein